MIINDNKFGTYKRVHKGDADILAENKISELLSDSEQHWNTIVKHKEYMKDIILTPFDTYEIVGDLFFEEEAISSMQMNIIKKEMEKPSFDYKVDANSAWALYNHITLSLKESHPTTWIQDQVKVHDVFDKYIQFEKA